MYNSSYESSFKISVQAGILARLEDIRDEILSKIMTNFQSRIRSYLALVDVKRRQQQRAGKFCFPDNLVSKKTES